MGLFDSILKRFQTARLMRATVSGDGSPYDKGFIDGVNYCEKVIFEEQQKSDQLTKGMWYTGNPNDLKPNNTGTYILIMKAHFDSEDGIEKDHIYIDTDFWNGTGWEGFEFGENAWELLYFTKLKWLRFRIPSELGIKKTDDLFIS